MYPFLCLANIPCRPWAHSSRPSVTPSSTRPRSRLRATWAPRSSRPLRLPADNEPRDNGQARRAARAHRDDDCAAGRRAWRGACGVDARLPPSPRASGRSGASSSRHSSSARTFHCNLFICLCGEVDACKLHGLATTEDTNDNNGRLSERKSSTAHLNFCKTGVSRPKDSAPWGLAYRLER